MLDKERQRRATAKTKAGGKSSFVWNEVVFNSFKSGYLKQIDFEFYKSLESAVSKRMYRFLDKRFYHRQRLEFDLRTFACEHIGLSKNYHNGELKRVLSPAIAELEGQGYLKKVAPEERFIRREKGSGPSFSSSRESTSRPPHPTNFRSSSKRSSSAASVEVPPGLWSRRRGE